MKTVGINLLRAGAMGTWLLAAVAVGVPPAFGAETAREAQ